MNLTANGPMNLSGARPKKRANSILTRKMAAVAKKLVRSGTMPLGSVKSPSLKRRRPVFANLLSSK